MSDDYYELLGVKRSADTDAIRNAYRERKEAIAAMTGGSAKSDAAALNKAWNVLSDPYQRGRYDATLDQGAAGEADADEPGTDVEVVDDAPPPRRGLFQPAPPRDKNAPKPGPTVTLPAGTSFPTQRRRVTAMVLDLALLLIVFAGSQFVAYKYNQDNHKSEIDQIEALDDQITGLDDQKSELEDQKDKLDADNPEDENEINDLDDEIKGIDTKVDDLDEQRADLNDELTPALNIASAVFFGFGLIYLVVPSALTGRTWGKRLQHITVVRVDGSPLGWAGAFSRYGILIVGTFAVSQLLGPLAVAVALFVVLGWMRNPNQQSLLDRMAKTLVVTEPTDA